MTDTTASYGAGERSAEDTLPENSEIEIKFAISPDQIRRIGHLGWLKQMQSGSPRRKTLAAVYYDTPDWSLQAKGVVVRVRKEGRRFIQCVKTRPADGSLIARGEWEMPTTAGRLDVAAITGTPGLDTVLTEAELEHVVPVFETRISRLSRTLKTPEGGTLSLDLDVGEIVAGDHVVPVRELELELQSGSSTYLFQVAHQIVESLDVRIGKYSKAQRGYMAAGQPQPLWSKHPIIKLARDATVEQVLAARVGACLSHLTANEDCVLARSHVEGVHQMRVAMRRLRALVMAFHDLIPEVQRAQFKPWAKRIVSVLGPARDWDVFLETTLPELRRGFPNEAALDTLQKAAEEARDVAYQEASALIASTDYTHMQVMLMDWLHRQRWREQPVSETSLRLLSNAAEYASVVLSKRHAKLLQRGARLRKLSSEERHDLRIYIKKMRYAAEIFAPLFPAKKTSRFLLQMENLQDSLGALNDLVVATHLTDLLCNQAAPTRRQALALAAGLTAGWFGHAASLHQPDLFVAWKTFAKTKPFWA